MKLSLNYHCHCTLAYSSKASKVLRHHHCRPISALSHDAVAILLIGAFLGSSGTQPFLGTFVLDNRMNSTASSSSGAAVPPLKRGRHQRHMAQVAAALPEGDNIPVEAPPVKTGSVLFTLLLQQWACGHMSAPKVQETAYAAYQDMVSMLAGLNLSSGHVDSSLISLAQLGSWGAHPNHIHEQRLAFLGEPVSVKATLYTIPCLAQKQKIHTPWRAENTRFPIVLPHEIFAHTYQHNPKRFRQLFLGDKTTPSERAAFWHELQKRKDPRLLGHPMTKMRNWAQKAIPLSLHGDGVPVVKVGKPGSESFETYSMQSLWAKGVYHGCEDVSFRHFRKLYSQTKRPWWL